MLSARVRAGTIGHVAHGKSTVVKAISGVHVRTALLRLPPPSLPLLPLPVALLPLLPSPALLPAQRAICGFSSRSYCACSGTAPNTSATSRCCYTADSTTAIAAAAAPKHATLPEHTGQA